MTGAVRTRRSEPKRPENFGAVMASLLAPLPDAEMEDRDLAKLERRAARAAKARAENEWHEAWLRQEALKHLYEGADMFLCMARMYPGSTGPVSAAEVQAARTRWYHAVDALMRIPSVKPSNLRWKKDHAKVVRRWPEDRFTPPNPEWAVLIAADEARFAQRH